MTWSVPQVRQQWIHLKHLFAPLVQGFPKSGPVDNLITLNFVQLYLPNVILDGKIIKQTWKY